LILDFLAIAHPSQEIRAVSKFSAVPSFRPMLQFILDIAFAAPSDRSTSSDSNAEWILKLHLVTQTQRPQKISLSIFHMILATAWKIKYGMTFLSEKNELRQWTQPKGNGNEGTKHMMKNLLTESN
jgi:hypothetical protein